VWILQKHKSKHFTFLFFKQNYNSNVYTHLEKVVVLVTVSTAKLGLLFLDFSTILQGAGLIHKTGNNLFALRTLELLKSSHKSPWFLPLGPDGGGKLAGGEVEHGQENKRWGSSIRLTRDRWVAVDRPEECPASGGGGAAAARPRELGRR
jgi:hypothetical protein